MSTQATEDQPQGGFFRETFRHAAIYSIATVLGRMISFIMLPFYAHILRDIGYGVIGMIDAALVFLSSLVGYKFQGAITRIYHEEQDVNRKKLVIPTGIMIVAGLTTILLIITSIFSRPLSHLLLGSSDYWYLIVIATAAFAIDMVGTSALTILLIQRRSVLYSMIGLSRLFTGVSLNILLVVILRWDLLGYFIASLVMSVVSTTISLTIAFRDCGTGFDRELARRLLAFQLPLIPGTFATFFARQIERVLVRFKIDLATVGILEMAYKFPVLLNILFIIPFMRSWTPKQIEIADEPGAPERMGKMFTYFVFLMLYGCLLLAVNIPVALKLLTPPEFWPGYRIARIEIMKIVAGACYMFLGFGLIYAKRTGVIARITIIISAVKVALSYVMITNWGIYGASWSACISMTTRTVWAYFLADRYYHIPIDWRAVLIICCIAVLIFAGVDGIETETIAKWGAPVLEKTSELLTGMEGTWFGRLKDGRIIQILIDKSDLLLELFVKTLLVSVYLILWPLARIKSRRQFMRFY